MIHASTLAELVSRLDTLSEDATRRWGRMSVGGMVCHLSDAFLMVMGERPFRRNPHFFERTVLRLIALHAPFRWLKGVPTAPIADQEKEGTRPGDFQKDKAALRELMERFSAEARSRPMSHPLFGELTPDELGRWGYRHVDHHLRQFGV